MKHIYSIIGLFFITLPANAHFKDEHVKSMGSLTTPIYNFTSFSKEEKRNLEEWKKWNGEKWLNHPEFGILPNNSPCQDCIEVYDKRKENERYFIDTKDSSKFYLQRSTGPLHFMENGQWRSINPNLKNEGTGIFDANNQPNPTGFDTKNKTSYIATSGGNIYFNNWQLHGIQKGVDTLLAIADWNHYTAGNDGLFITNIFPGMDAQMKVSKGTIETNFIIKTNKYATMESLFFSDEFLTAGNLQLVFATNQQSSQRIDDVKVLADQTEVLKIKKAVAYPIANPSFITGLEYAIQNKNIQVVVPVDWLNNQLLKNGSIIIDPQVSTSNSVGIGGSMYNGGCNWSSGCSNTLSITPPAKAVYTDILCSFTYFANSPCTLGDGAFSLFLGGCSSSNWSIPASDPAYGSQGTATMVNVSLMSYLGSCLPPPSCSPSAISFRLDFARKCIGPGGCDGSCIGPATAWTITIVGKTLEFSSPAQPIVPSATTLCLGDSITAGTNATYGVGPYKYSWSVDAGATLAFSSSGSSIAKFIFPSAGSYNIYTTVTDACNNTVNAQKSITVNPLPSIAVSLSKTVTCAGDPITVTGLGGTSYQWSNGNTTATFTENPTVTTAYIVTGTDANNCSALAVATATVNPLPLAQIISTPSFICFGDSAILIASGGIKYLWSTAATSTSIQVWPDTTSNYAVTVTDVNNCSASKSYNLIVHPLPIVVITPDTDEICYGESVSLMATGATNYFWSTNAITNQITKTPLVNTQYNVTGTDNNGCVNSDSILITVHPLPIPYIEELNEQQCYGFIVKIKADGGIRYNWSTGEDLQTISTYPISDSTFYVTITDFYNCSADTSVWINAKDPYVVNATLVNPPCPPANIGTIKLDVSGNNGGYQYMWNTNDSTKNIDSLAQGTFNVNINDSLNCDTILSYNLVYDYILDVNISPVDTTVPDGVYVQLQSSVNVNNGVKYSWSPFGNLSCFFCDTPVFRANKPFMNYSVRAVDKYGCSDTAFTTAKTFDITPIFIPNAFTPNGDGKNDFFELFGPGVRRDYMPKIELKIFNRWGEKVYETTDQNFKWDGKYKGEYLSLGVYIYHLHYLLIGQDNPIDTQGSITIIR